MSTWEEVIEEIETGVARQIKEAQDRGEPPPCQECARLTMEINCDVTCRECSDRLAAYFKRNGGTYGPGI